MKRLTTSELSGIALDWAVATAQGYPDLLIDASLPSYPILVLPGEEKLVDDFYNGWRPSELWEQGGPIIEKEKISVGFERYGSPSGAQWDAVKVHKEAHVLEYGPTPLIAAMRCFVAAKLGVHVDVPDELVL